MANQERTTLAFDITHSEFVCACEYANVPEEDRDAVWQQITGNTLTVRLNDVTKEENKPLLFMLPIVAVLKIKNEL